MRVEQLLDSSEVGRIEWDLEALVVASDTRALRARGVLLVAGGFGYTFNITNVNSSANKITSPTNRSLVVVLD